MFIILCKILLVPFIVALYVFFNFFIAKKLVDLTSGRGFVAQMRPRQRGTARSGSLTA